MKTLILLGSVFLAATIPTVWVDSSPTESVWLAGSYADGTGTYHYGHRIRNAPVDYDGLLLIADAADQTVLAEKTFDRGGWEPILFLGAYEDGTLFLLLRIRETDPKALEETDRLCWLRIDRMGTVLAETELDPAFSHFHNIGWQLILRTDSAIDPPLAIGPDGAEKPFSIPEEAEGMYVLQHQGQAFVDGESVEKVTIPEPGFHAVRIVHAGQVFDFSIRGTPVIDGIEPGGEYTEPVRIVSPGVLFVDGRPFSSGDTVSEPGNHVLEVHGRGDDVTAWPFVLHPTVDNIEPDSSVRGPIRVFSNAPSMALDGIPIPQGTWIARSGFYRLTLSGVNGYEREIRFGILPSVQGLTDGAEYTEQAVFFVNGTATLDGKELHGEEQTITVLGNHVLMLWLGTERTAVYTFTVTSNPPEEGSEAENIPWSWIETGLGIMVLVGLFLVLKKK